MAMDDVQQGECLGALVWCETIAANGREHLRRLSDAGPKYGGGSDTPTLCGMQAAWDLRGAVSEETVRRRRVAGLYSYPCTQCVAALDEAGP